jgi:hypothetical protein
MKINEQGIESGVELKNYLRSNATHGMESSHATSGESKRVESATMFLEKDSDANAGYRYNAWKKHCSTVQMTHAITHQKKKLFGNVVLDVVNFQSTFRYTIEHFCKARYELVDFKL